MRLSKVLKDQIPSGKLTRLHRKYNCQCFSSETRVPCRRRSCLVFPGLYKSIVGLVANLFNDEPPDFSNLGMTAKTDLIIIEKVYNALTAGLGLTHVFTSPMSNHLVLSKNMRYVSRGGNVPRKAHNFSADVQAAKGRIV